MARPVFQAWAAPAGQGRVVRGERRRDALQFLMGQLQAVEQAPGVEAAGDSRALREEVDSNLAWEQTARLHSDELLYLV